METLTDDNAPSTPAPISQDMGRVFTFAGITLKPYSTAREACFERMGEGNLMYKEDAIYHIYICTLGHVECSAIRSDFLNKARAAAMEWFDVIESKSGKNLIPEIMTLSQEILNDRKAARSIEPDAPNGSGNV